MENAGYLFAAFSIIWIFILIYMFFLFKRQNKLKYEIDLLKKNPKGIEDSER